MPLLNLRMSTALHRRRHQQDRRAAGRLRVERRHAGRPGRPARQCWPTSRSPATRRCWSRRSATWASPDPQPRHRRRLDRTGRAGRGAPRDRGGARATIEVRSVRGARRRRERVLPWPLHDLARAGRAGDRDRIPRLAGGHVALFREVAQRPGDFAWSAWSAPSRSTGQGRPRRARLVRHGANPDQGAPGRGGAARPRARRDRSASDGRARHRRHRSVRRPPRQRRIPPHSRPARVRPAPCARRSTGGRRHERASHRTDHQRPPSRRDGGGADLVRIPARRCGYTGTHVGCEHGVCGACTVIVDGARRCAPA